MEKILIKSNEEMAGRWLKDLRKDIDKINALVTSYNSFQLEKLTTVKQVEEFLKAPLKYFEDQILLNSGISFQRPVDISVEGIAQLLKIPYTQFRTQIEATNLVNMKYFHVNSKLRIEVSPEGEKQIYELSKVYLTDPEEVELYKIAENTCKTILNHMRAFDIKETGLQSVASFLGLIWDVMDLPEGGRGWAFRPDEIKIKRVVEKHKISRS